MLVPEPVPLQPIAESSVVSPPSSNKSRFAAIPWHFRDIVSGLLPVFFFRALSLSPTHYRMIPLWLRIALSSFFLLWIVVYPLAMAQQRTFNWSWRAPPLRKVFVELAWSIPLTVAALALIGVVVFALYYSGGDRLMPRDVLDYDATSLSTLYYVWLICACTIAPVGEEIFMRGFLYNALKRSMPMIVALVLQAALFAICHPQPPTNMVVLFSIGLFLGAMYEWRKTLVAPIFIHAAVNSITVVILLITVDYNARAPVLGVNGEDREGESGCIVTVIVEGSAAEMAGLQIGDVIVAMDGEAVTNFRHLVTLIRSRSIGQTITIQFFREREYFETRAVLTDRKKPLP